MFVVLAFMCAFLIVSPAQAQRTLTETEFLDALDRDDRIQAILDEPVAEARAQRARAATVPNLSASFEREAPDGGASQNTWGATWSPPFDGRRGLAIRAADANLQAAELDSETSRLALREEVRAVYADWAMAFERARLSESLSATVAQVVRQMEQRALRGEASGLSARRFALAGAELRAGAAQAAAELEVARASVSVWIPTLPAGATPVRPALPPLVGSPSEFDSVPVVQARRLEVQSAEASVRLQNRFWEVPELAFGWQTIKDGSDELEGPVFGVSWPLPLFDRNQAERALAQAQLTAARSRQSLVEAQARARLEGALSGYSRLRKDADSMRDLDSVAEQTIRSATAMFEAGEGNVTDLLETLRGALSGVEASLELFAHALRAHRELELAAGRALPLIEGDSR